MDSGFFPASASTPRSNLDDDLQIYNFYEENLKALTTEASVKPGSSGNTHKFRHLYETGKHSDVTLEVGTSETKIFYVHKLVLSMSSRVFKTLFQNPSEEPGFTLRIGDVDAESCDRMLRFIYCCEFDGNEESKMATDIATAKRFDIPDYIQACLQHFEKNLSVQNLFFAYDLALKENSETLKKLARVMLNSKLSLVIQLPGFYECSHELMEEIARDVSEDISPKQLFTILLSWSQNHLLNNSETTTLQTVFSSFLPYIRFLELSHDEFNKFVVKCGVLNLKDANRIRNHILGMPWKCELPVWCLPGTSRTINKYLKTPIGSKKVVNSGKPVVQLCCTFSVAGKLNSVRIMGVCSRIRKFTGCKDMRWDKSIAYLNISGLEQFCISRIKQIQNNTYVLFTFEDVTLTPKDTCTINLTVVSKDKGRYQFEEGSYQETTVETTLKNGEATAFSIRFTHRKGTTCGLISHLFLKDISDFKM